MDGTTQLLESDRRFLVHPLHHPEEHKAPLLVDERQGRDAASRRRARGHRRAGRAVERQCRAWPRRVGRCRRRADAQDRLCLGLCRRHQRAGDPARREDRRPRLQQQLGGVLHDRRRGIERVGVQDRALLLEGQGQAEQDQDHLAHPRLSRRHDGGDERHRHGRLSQDVRAAGARLHPGRGALRLSLAGQPGSRASAPPRRSRRRSSPKGRTRSRR